MHSPSVEFWVVRVVLHSMRGIGGRPLLSTLARVDAGAYLQLPDGAIAEPVECHASHADAQMRIEQLKAQHPNEDLRVVLNRDVSPERD